MRKFYLSLLLVFTIIMGYQNAWATHGTLQIIAFGKSDKAPNGDWVNGVGSSESYYRINMIDLVKLVDQYNGKLTLRYDNFSFNGNLDLRFSGDYDIDLAFLTSNEKNSSITFEPSGRITLTAGEGHHAKITFGAAKYSGSALVDAEEAIFSDEVFDFERVEMNGFKNWTQTEIDQLIAKSSKRGSSITEMSGDKRAYDFTYYTTCTANNGVFSMQATVDFLNGNGMGFKNLDRPGLLSNGTSMSPYPAHVFCDLSKAEGIRFKVNVEGGSVGSLNIGLSNQMSPNKYDYFMYDIPLSAADENGYITLPFGLFDPEYGSDDLWDFRNPEVISIEAINVKKGTTISFSDMHGYKYSTSHSGTLNMCAMYRTNSGQKTTLRADKEMTQQSGADGMLYVQGQLNLECQGKIAFTDTNNAFTDVVNISATEANINIKKAYASNKTHFNFIPQGSYKVKNVYLDNTDLGAITEYDFVYPNSFAHNIKVVFEFDKNFVNKIVGPANTCEEDMTKYSAQTEADSYTWYFNGNKVSEKSTYTLPYDLAVNTYELVLHSQITQQSETLTTKDTLKVTVWPIYETNIQDTIALGETYTKNGFNITPERIGSKYYYIDSTSSHGCDSSIILQLFVRPFDVIKIIGKHDICEGEEATLTAQGYADSYTWYCNGSEIAKTQSVVIPATSKVGIYNYVLKTHTESGNAQNNTCDTFIVNIWAKESTTIKDTIMLGETYAKNGFNVKPTEVGTTTYYDTLVNAHGCDSLVTLELTTTPSNGIHQYGQQTIAIYPNPASQNIHVTTQTAMNGHNMYLFDLQGRLVMAQKITSTDMLLNIETLNSGIYILKVDNQTMKIVKQ